MNPREHAWLYLLDKTGQLGEVGVSSDGRGEAR